MHMYSALTTKVTTTMQRRQGGVEVEWRSRETRGYGAPKQPTAAALLLPLALLCKLLSELLRSVPTDELAQPDVDGSLGVVS